MEFISVRQLRTQSAGVWDKLAKSGDLVVTTHGRPVAVLSATTGATLEATLASLRQARAQLAVTAMQQRAREAGADQLSLEDINAEIEAARHERPR